MDAVSGPTSSGGATTAREPAASDACRTPYTITVRVGTETQTLQGCRGEDDGGLSRLVRDGEFLLYSTK
jgi:hypothetical protein